MANEISELLDQLDVATHQYVVNGYNALVSNYSTLMTSVIVAYIAWIGWKTLYHHDGFSAGNFLKESLKIAVIYSIATNWGFYTTYLYNVLTNGPNEIAGVLMHSAGSAYDSSNSALQSAFDQGMQAGSEMWAKGGLTHPLPWFFAGDIWIATGVLVGFSVVAIAVAKVFLAVLIVLAPVFVYFLLSESFKGITEAWLKLALGFALVPLFIDSSLLFTNGIIEYGLNKIAALPNSVSGLGMAAGGIVVFDIVVCICCALLWHAGKIAAQIGGGMSVNSLETSGALSLMRNPITSAPRVVGGFVGKKTGSAIKGRWANRKSKKG